MSNKDNTDGLNPDLLITLSDFAKQVISMSDDEIESQMEVYASATHTGKWGRDRLEILTNERSRRWRQRRGEGREDV